MPQKLILPINKCLVTASYKTTAYKARFGFSHFGADMISFSGQNIVFASGTGTVIATGMDNLLGSVVIVRYDDTANHRTGKMQSVIARYYHLMKILVSSGEAVGLGTPLAIYGNTGKYSTGAHLHIEFDSNVAAPKSSKTISSNSNIIQASPNDTTIDPFELLHLKVSLPDRQEIKVDKSTYDRKYYAMQEIVGIPKV